jgi:hypothetical protein
MSFKDLYAFPALIPIPQLNCHIIASSKNETLGRMDSYCANVIGVCFKASNLLRSIVVQDAQLKVVRTSDNPILPCDETTSANRYISKLECLNCAACFVGPDVDMATIQSGKDPWFCEQVRIKAKISNCARLTCGMKVYALDPLGSSE